MAIETITGGVSSPTFVSVRRDGGTYVVDEMGSVAGARLPGTTDKLGIEFTFVCLNASGLVVYPSGTDVIYCSDQTSGSGDDDGCLVCTDQPCVLTVRAVTGGWAVTGIAGWWDVRLSYSISGNLRGAVRGAYGMTQAQANLASAAGASSAPTGVQLGLSFVNGADHDCCFTFVMPADWQPEGDITPHLWWYKTTSASGTVKWQTRYRLGKPGVGAITAFSAWADASAAVAADGDTAERLAISKWADIDMASTAIGHGVILDVRRQGSSGSDTYGAAAVLLSAAIQYPIDVPGWSGVYAK